jgi:hypothetical protein
MEADLCASSKFRNSHGDSNHGLNPGFVSVIFRAISYGNGLTQAVRRGNKYFSVSTKCFALCA